MNTKIICSLLLVLSAFLSCKERNDNSFREYAIQGEIRGDEIFATRPIIHCLDSLVIAYSNRTLSGRIITAYSPRDNFKEVASYGTIGRGPNEYIALEINSAHGNYFYGRNANMSELVAWKVGMDINGIQIKEVERLKYERIVHDDMASEDGQITYLDEGHFIGVSYGGQGKFFSLYDDRMKWLGHFGDAPIPDDVQRVNARQFLNGRLATHNGDFVYLPMRLPKIAFYGKTEGANVPQKLWEDTFYDSYYNVSNGRIAFSNSKTVGVVMDAKMGEQYIYVLFLDIPLGDLSAESSETSAANIIFVFDHQGTHIARLNLNHRLTSFSVTADEKTIYGIAPTPEDRFVEFTLPEF